MRTCLRVGAIIFYKNKLITTRMQKDKSTYHVLPGGGVEYYETIYEAIKREVKEEINLEIIKLRLVYIRELNIKDKGRGVEFYFYVEEYNGEPQKGLDPETKESSFEGIDFVSLDELNDIIFHPKQLVNVLKEDKEKNFDEVKYLGLHDYS